MKSIRGRLTVWLLAGMGLLLAAGGFLLDRVIGSRLLRELDAQLIQEARSLISSTEQQDGRVSLELADGVLPEFEPGGEPDYFQIWSGQGSPLARSRSLGARSLPRPGTPAVEPRLADFTLPDGRPGRKIEISYRPQVEREAGGEERESIVPAPPDSPLVTLVVASGREDLDAFLASLHLTLVLAVLGLLAATAILVKTALRAGLAPLDQLAGRLDSMNADSLGEPVAAEGVPAELAPTVRHLNGLLARLKESFERERTFSANLAHELRTPLAELRAVTEVALKWPDGSSLKSLEEAHSIGLQMERVVVNLLALARYDGRQQAAFPSEVPLREAAADGWSAFAEEAGARGIELDLDIPAGLVLVTDRDKLDLILSNLFANAVAYGVPGRPVACSAAVSGRDFALRIANATEELTPADLPRLFDRFWRKDAARSGGQHAGLGLSLVGALCELLGFKREARLRGDVFEITLSKEYP
jgi:two-component system sensor histidine kinase QseC